MRLAVRVGGNRARTAIVASLALLMVGVAMAAPHSATAAADSQGRNFWLAFPGNCNVNLCANKFDPVPPSADQTLFITGSEATDGTVEIPGLGFSLPFTVTPGSATSVSLPADTDLSVGEGTQAKGIHVTADREVSVYGLNSVKYTTDAYLGLPTDVLGTEYIVLGFGPGAGAQLGIAASQDATTVTITPKVAGAGGHPAGVPYDVSMNRGDAYQLQASTTSEDLSGSLVTADKPIAVFGGNECAKVPDENTNACDHVVEQMPPTDTWGTSFATVPLKTRKGGDTFAIVASQDGTNVQINGASVASLNRGQVHQQLIDGRSTIRTNNPVLVAQFSNGSSFDRVTSDPFEMLIPPLEQFQDRYTVTTPASGFPENFINLVVPESDVGKLKVDGNAIASSSFDQIGASGFYGARVDVSSGAHSLRGTKPFGAFQYGYADYESYGYPGGQLFAPIAEVISITLVPEEATHDVGTEHCVTATPRTQDGTPIPEVRIDFVVRGANTGSASINANGLGESPYCYTGTRAGDDTITASIGSISAMATKTWVATLASGNSRKVCGRTPAGVDLKGDRRKNKLAGTPRVDRLRGGRGADKLLGAAAGDCLRGQADEDLIRGNDGRDLIRGGGGEDTIFGGKGDDDVRAQDAGRDTIRAGSGNDRIKAQGRGSDWVKCGAGRDQVIGDVKDRISKDCEKVHLVDPR